MTPPPPPPPPLHTAVYILTVGMHAPSPAPYASVYINKILHVIFDRTQSLLTFGFLSVCELCPLCGRLHLEPVEEVGEEGKQVLPHLGPHVEQVLVREVQHALWETPLAERPHQPQVVQRVGNAKLVLQTDV